MSFSRFGPDSDTYTFPCVSGVYECCMCALNPDGDSYRTPSVEAFLEHLDLHTLAGHAVPDYTRGAVAHWHLDNPDGWRE